MDVYDKLIFKYPPEINKLDILNNLKIIRKTLIRYASPLLLFLLLILIMKKVNRPIWLNWLYLIIFLFTSFQLFTFWSNKLL